MWRLFAGFLASALLAGGAACTTGDSGNDDAGELRVFAAASLTDAFEELGQAYEDANPGMNVAFNFAGSSSLAVQIRQGAPADVFASANMEQMELVQTAGLAGEASIFATNSLVVVTPAGSDTVGTFADLATPGVRLVVAAPEVPAGAFARRMLERAGELPQFDAGFAGRVLENVVSNETSVRAVLTKVELGEADAGIVYETDARVAGRNVERIAVPGEANVTARYAVAVLSNAENPRGAQSFVDFALSETGQAILAGHGFGRP